MRYKIVYDVISTLEDTFFEQAWASIFSLKYYNPSAHVVLLTDQATKDTIYSESRKNSLELIDEIIVVSFNADFSNKEKSRWIKTSMRQLIKGDFLFIDADTIITDSLDRNGDLADNVKGFIGATLDNHCHSSEMCDTFIFKEMYTKRLSTIFGITLNKNTDVFNSGVLFVRDVIESYNFFEKWHDNWLTALRKGICLDQLPLVKTCQELNNPITALSGEYNCQIRSSIKYLSNAIIVHTFSHQKGANLSPIFDDELFQEIKTHNGLTEHVQQILINCKESFYPQTFIVGKEWLDIKFTPTFALLYKVCTSKGRAYSVVKSFMNFVSRSIDFILRQFHL